MIRPGESSRPSITKSPIWASQATPSANDLVAVRCGSSVLPSTSAATYTAAKPDPCTNAAAPYARKARVSTASGYRPEEGSAARRMTQAPPNPAARPNPVPTTSSYPTIPSTASTPCSCAAPDDTSVTSTTVGASLRPDSASSVPVSRRGSGTTRSTENTAAASVGEVTAPSSTASCHGSPST
ncbi:hypothetical protein ACVW2K_000411 [Nocardioides sp. HB32]